MNNQIITFFFCALCCARTAAAQDTIPVLKGKINLSIARGTIECDFTLSNMPRLNNYVIRINSGMNIFYFKDLDYNTLIQYEKSFMDTMSTGESTAYYFPSGNDRKGRFLPAAVQVRYVGMFPVIPEGSGQYSAEDWKGNVAFNGYSLRVDGRQSAWYPILYDIENDRPFSQVQYDIEVDCADCKTIYVNGSLPTKGPIAKVKSDIPYEMTMFAGNYEASEVNGTYFLNPDLDKQELSEFGSMTSTFKSYLGDKLGVPYKGNPVFIQTTPTSERNAWLFVSYPTIVNIGRGKWSMKKFMDKSRADWSKPYIAHELGHYYFGTYRVFNSTLGDMMSEGFSEFLSFKVTRALISDSVYRRRLQDKANMIKDFKPVPFSKAVSHSDYVIREFYVYYYAPIIFLAIEQEIGEKNMWKWLNSILNTKSVFTDYSFLRQTLDRTLNNAELVDSIEKKYFSSDKAVENAVEKLGLK